MGRFRVIYWYVCNNSHFSRIYSRHDTVAIALWECVRKWYNLYPPSDSNKVLTLWYPKSSEQKRVFLFFFFGKRSPPVILGLAAWLRCQLQRAFRFLNFREKKIIRLQYWRFISDFSVPFFLKDLFLSNVHHVPGRCAGLSSEGTRNHLAMSKD